LDIGNHPLWKKYIYKLYHNGRDYVGYNEFNIFIKFVKKEILIFVVAFALSAVVAHNLTAAVSLYGFLGSSTKPVM